METALEPKYMTIEEIKTSYPGEWVLLGDPVKEGLTMLGGVVLHHHPDKRELAYEGRRLAKGYARYRWVFAGDVKRMPQIGIFRKITLQHISVKMNPQTNQWNAFDKNGNLIKAFDSNFTAEKLWDLDLS